MELWSEFYFLNSSLIWAATKSTENVASEENVLSSMTLEEKSGADVFRNA